MNKYFLPACGELFWAVILRAHAHWLEQQGHKVMICCYPDLRPLFKDFEIQHIPDEFHQLYGNCPQDSMGRYRGNERIPWQELHQFFEKYKPEGYEFSPYIKLTYIPRNKVYQYCLWKPFKAEELQFKEPRIVIFPRYRESKQHSYRNLRREFYVNLIKKLTKEGYLVFTMGTKNGAYSILKDEIGDNYLNLVGKTNSIQDVFNISQYSICTIGGTSSLTKMCGMLEKPIPSYVIGHEEKRFQQEENFFNAKVGFYNCGKETYQNFNEEECIEQIIKFVKELK